MAKEKKIIQIEVRDKVARLVNEDEFLVCGNSDYEVHFDFDDSWEYHNAKTALFVFGDTTIEQPFIGEHCDGVAIEKATKCYIGVFSGNIVTTTKAEIKCVPSIRDIAKTPKAPEEDVYNKIISLINKMSNGENGEKAIIIVEKLPDTNIVRNAFYRFDGKVYWYDGKWHQLIDIEYFEKVLGDELSKKQDELYFEDEYDKNYNRVATVATVTRKISELISGAPEDLNTLKELADWLKNHGMEAAEMNSRIVANSQAIVKANETSNEAKSIAQSISGVAVEALNISNRAFIQSEGLRQEIENVESKISDYIEEASAQIEENILPKINEVEENTSKAVQQLGDTKQDKLEFDGKYDSQSNKAATVKTVIDKVAEIIAGAPENFDTLKELSDWLTAHASSAAEMNSAINQNTNAIAEINEGLTEYVKNTYYADKDTKKAGLMYPASRSLLVSNGGLYIVGATENMIQEKASSEYPITPSMLNIVMKVGLTMNTKEEEELSDKEKSKAHKWLGLYYEEDGAEYKATSYYLSAGYGHGFYGADTVGIATNSELGNLETISIYELDKYEVTINKKDNYDPTKPIDEDKTYPLEEFEVNEVNGGYILALKGVEPRAYIYIVEDFAVFNSSYYTNFTFNGVYLGHSYNDSNDINGNTYSSYITVKSIIAKNITPVPNRFLDLANHIDIKRLGNAIDNLSYDDLNGRPFYTEFLPDTISMKWDGDTVSLGDYGTAYFQTDKTYAIEQLIGATLTFSDMGNSVEVTISDSITKDATSDGFYYGYNRAYMFIAYTDNYKPNIATTAFPKAGIYFSTDMYGDVYPKSLTNIRTAKKLDNIYLDLENNSYLQSTIGNIETALDSIIALQNSLIGGEA